MKNFVLGQTKAQGLSSLFFSWQSSVLALALVIRHHSFVIRLGSFVYHLQKARQAFLLHSPAYNALVYSLSFPPKNYSLILFAPFISSLPFMSHRHATSPVPEIAIFNSVQRMQSHAISLFVTWLLVTSRRRARHA